MSTRSRAQNGNVHTTISPSIKLSNRIQLVSNLANYDTEYQFQHSFHAYTIYQNIIRIRLQKDALENWTLHYLSEQNMDAYFDFLLVRTLSQ